MPSGVLVGSAIAAVLAICALIYFKAQKAGTDSVTADKAEADVTAAQAAATSEAKQTEAVLKPVTTDQTIAQLYKGNF